jgi:hypothetical protein
MNDQEVVIAQQILITAKNRGPKKSTCPSEIARALYPEDWRRHMDKIRKVAVELAKSGKVMITQKGVPVDIEQIKGPIRIKISNRYR